MGATNVLPPPLDVACRQGHALELWILVNGEIVPCAGAFMRPDEEGRPQLAGHLPEIFGGVVRPGAAVRGFFVDDSQQVHTFLTAVHDWQPFADRPTSARVVLQSPTAVSPCQRRRGLRQQTRPLPVSLQITVRGRTEGVTGQLLDVSLTGLGVRMVRASRNWFERGTSLEIEVAIPERPQPLRLAVTVARSEEQSLHYRYGLRVNSAAERRRLQDVIEAMLPVDP